MCFGWWVDGGGSIGWWVCAVDAGVATGERRDAGWAINLKVLKTEESVRVTCTYLMSALLYIFFQIFFVQFS